MTRERVRTRRFRVVLLSLLALFGCADEPVDGDTESSSPFGELAAEGTTPGPLLSDDFESGQLASPPWTINGDTTVRADAARGGTHGVRLGRAASLVATLDTTGRKDITVSYDIRAVALDYGEYVAISWALPGRSFTLLSRTASPSWATGKVTLPAAAANVKGVRVRFAVRAFNFFGIDRSFEGAYLDNVVVNGTTTGGETPGCTSDAACSSLNGPCQRGTCDVATGQCAAKPIDGCQACSADDDCSDDNACNGAEKCTSGRCVAATAPSCADDNPCTADACSAQSGCTHTPTPGAACPNGMCNAAGACEPRPVGCTSNASCSNLNGPCTTGVCNVSSGQCSAQPIPNCKACTTAAECGDGNACNGAEACQAGRCVAGTALVCNDSKPCTADSCNPAMGCQYVPTAGLPCPNGTCNAAGVCEQAPPRCTSNASCSNLNGPCTTGVCNLTSGQCAAQPIAGCTACMTDAQCTNNNLCDGAEKCQAGRCVAGTALSCADSSACTRDTCNPQTGCMNAITPGATCPGGTCSATGACVPSGPKCSQRNTYDAIQKLIFDSTTYGCTASYCHGGADTVLDLRAGYSYDALVEHDHGALIVPGNANGSVLYDRLRAKVQGTTPTMGGSPMPLGAAPAISRAQLDALALWINQGAPETGLVAGTEAGLCLP